MADVREKLFALVETKMKAITIANGFSFDMKGVFRSQEEAIDVQEHPSVIIEDLGEDSRFHIRKAYENRVHVSIQMVEHDYDDEKIPIKVAEVLSTIKKQIVANEFWNDGSEDLAVATVVLRNSPSFGKSERPIGTDRIDFDVVQRVVQSDPDTVKVF